MYCMISICSFPSIHYPIMHGRYNNNNQSSYAYNNAENPNGIPYILSPPEYEAAVTQMKDRFIYLMANSLGCEVIVETETDVITGILYSISEITDTIPSIIIKFPTTKNTVYENETLSIPSSAIEMFTCKNVDLSPKSNTAKSPKLSSALAETDATVSKTSSPSSASSSTTPVPQKKIVSSPKPTSTTTATTATTSAPTSISTSTSPTPTSISTSTPTPTPTSSAPAAYKPPTPSTTNIASEIKKSFKIDSDISTVASSEQRELKKWKPDTSVVLPTLKGGLDSESLESGSWDQFEVNKSKFGIEANFDENEYTVKLDTKNPKFEERMKVAKSVEKDILSQSANGNLHMAEERGEVIDIDNIDEEDKYSGVLRDNKESERKIMMMLKTDSKSSQQDSAPTKKDDSAPVAKIIKPITNDDSAKLKPKPKQKQKLESTNATATASTSKSTSTPAIPKTTSASISPASAPLPEKPKISELKKPVAKVENETSLSASSTTTTSNTLTTKSDSKTSATSPEVKKTNAIPNKPAVVSPSSVTPFTPTPSTLKSMQNKQKFAYGMKNATGTAMPPRTVQPHQHQQQPHQPHMQHMQHQQQSPHQYQAQYQAHPQAHQIHQYPPHMQHIPPHQLQQQYQYQQNRPAYPMQDQNGHMNGFSQSTHPHGNNNYNNKYSNIQNNQHHNNTYMAQNHNQKFKKAPFKLANGPCEKPKTGSVLNGKFNILHTAKKEFLSKNDNVLPSGKIIPMNSSFSAGPTWPSTTSASYSDKFKKIESSQHPGVDPQHQMMGYASNFRQVYQPMQVGVYQMPMNMPATAAYPNMNYSAFQY